MWTKCVTRCVQGVGRQKDQCYQRREKPSINNKTQTIRQSSRGGAWAIPRTIVVYAQAVLVT